MSDRVITTFRKERSLNGYSLDVLKSAIQKYTRRCNFDKLLWSIFEYDTFLVQELNRDVIRIRTNLYHRMLIIFLEDIGSCGIYYTMQMKNILDTLENCRSFTESGDINTYTYSKYKQYEIFEYIKWAWICANTKKSRESDHYNVYYTRLQDHVIPDNLNHILDITIMESEKVQEYCNQFVANLKLRNINSLYWAYKIVNQKLSKTYFNKKKPEYLVFWLIKYVTVNWEYSEFLQIYMEWFNILKNNPESFLCWVNLIISYCKQNSQTDNLELSQDKIDELYLKYTDNYLKAKIQFEEYIYDMHTYIGKTAGKSYKYFANVSSCVENEDSSVDPNIKKLYNDYFTDRDREL